MSDDEGLHALEVIIAEVERLRVLVSASRYITITTWLEGALADARAQLGKRRAAVTGLPLNEVPTEPPGMRAAKRHVADAEGRVARQREIVERLSRDGLNTTTAEAILATFMDVLLVRRAMLSLAEDEVSGNRPWRPIATAPFNTTLEVAVIGPDDVNVRGFACRRELEGWLNIETDERVNCDATHWRLWQDRAD